MPAAPQEKIDALLSGQSWSSIPGQAVTVSYAFLTSVPTYYSPEDEGFFPANFTSFNALQEIYALQALALWSDVANITFVNDPLLADITFGNALIPPLSNGTIIAGQAFFPGTSSAKAGDIWINNSFSTLSSNGNPFLGSAGFDTLLHEIGHALGLKHPFEGFAQLQRFGDNSTQYTVMSYTQHPSAPFSNALTPLLYDIAAIQYLYGANMTTRSGNDTYTFSSSEADLTAIWDAGGTDTIDASNQNVKVVINLNEGAFSSIGPFLAALPQIPVGNNVAIAYGVTIENAIGGSGEDTVIGNDVANILEGRASDDRLYGGGGADILYGGNGSNPLANSGNDVLDGGGADGADDRLIGGDGNDDYILYVGGGKDVIVDNSGIDWIFEGTASGGRFALSRRTAYRPGDSTVNSWTTPGGEITFTLNSPLTITDNATGLQVVIENWQPGDFGIYLTDLPQAITPTRDITGDLTPIDFNPPNQSYQTDDLGNLIVDPNQAAPGRHDRLDDSVGSDHIVSGAGSDQIDFDSTTVGQGLGSNARGGNDWIQSGDGRDVVFSGSGNDLIEGGAGGTEAQLGDHTIVTTPYGGDILLGGAGDDRIYGGSEIDLSVAIAAGNTQGATGLEGDWLSGQAGDDILVTGADNDLLAGGSGADLLIGGAGDDNLLGDANWVLEDWGWSYHDEPPGPGERTGSRVFDLVVGEVNPLDGGADTIYAGDGIDYARGGRGDDVIYGESGNDDLGGEWGNDELFGGAGNDFLAGDGVYMLNDAEHGNDYLDGGEGNDTLQGNGGADDLFGGVGNDTLIGDDQFVSTAFQGADYLDGEDGNDHLEGGGGDDTLFGGAGADEMLGGNGDDSLEGETENDVAFGEAGNDFLDGGDGDDYLDGGDGNDTLYGGAGNDTLKGQAGNDYLDGGDGDDFMEGGDGDDTLIGGAGADVLNGGAGDNTIVANLAEGDIVIGGPGARRAGPGTGRHHGGRRQHLPLDQVPFASNVYANLGARNRAQALQRASHFGVSE